MAEGTALAIEDDGTPIIPPRVRRMGMKPIEMRECRKFMGFKGKASASENEPVMVDDYITKFLKGGPSRTTWIDRIHQAQERGDIPSDWTFDEEECSNRDLVEKMVCWFYSKR